MIVLFFLVLFLPAIANAIGVYYFIKEKNKLFAVVNVINGINYVCGTYFTHWDWLIILAFSSAMYLLSLFMHKYEVAIISFVMLLSNAVAYFLADFFTSFRL